MEQNTCLLKADMTQFTAQVTNEGNKYSIKFNIHNMSLYSIL